jgi:hypothetical protein
LAQQFVLRDESQLLFYEQRVREMPVRVLARHGVVKHDKGVVTLEVPRLSLEQKAHVRMLCEQRLQEYIQKRGVAIWDYRMLDATPVPHDLRYHVLAKSDERCELCGGKEQVEAALPTPLTRRRFTWLVQGLLNGGVPIIDRQEILAAAKELNMATTPLLALVRAARLRLRRRLPGNALGATRVALPVSFEGQLLGTADGRCGSSELKTPLRAFSFQQVGPCLESGVWRAGECYP